MIQQDHHTVYYRVKFRPIQWDPPQRSEVPNPPSYQEAFTSAQSFLQEQSIEGASSAMTENMGQVQDTTLRRCSSLLSPKSKKPKTQHTHSTSPPMLEQPILPTPHLDSDSQIDNRNGFIRQENLASSGPSAGWHPFHIFSATPNTSRRISSVSSEASSHEAILEDQQEFFRKMERICTRAAKKYWQNQACHLNTTNGNNSERRRGYAEEEGGVTLMEYVQRINHMHFKCAQSCKNNNDVAMAETLMRTMTLLTWAEQVRGLAVNGGREMSDDAIMRAVIGARDLICWLLDDEGEAAFNQMWEGKFVYGGLVMSEDNLCCCN